MSQTPNPNDLVRVILPFTPGAKGAGLKEAAQEIFQRHGADLSIDAVMEWSYQAAAPLESKVTGVVEETVPFYGAMYQWAKLSYPHFSLTPDFFSAVALTDFGDPTEEPLYMPFDAFTVSFPPTEFFDQASKLMVYKVPTLLTSAAGTIKTLRWKLYRATLFKHQPIFTQWTIGMTRKALAEEAATLDLAVPGRGIRPLDVGEKELPLRMRTLLANVLTYIEAQGPLPTIPRARKGALPAAVELTHPTQPIYEVGRIVKLDGGLRKAIADSAGSQERWHVAQRFVVRGHWRNQAYGEGRQLRRRQWIEPHWKGPENAVDAITRTYEVT